MVLVAESQVDKNYRISVAKVRLTLQVEVGDTVELHIENGDVKLKKKLVFNFLV